MSQIHNFEYLFSPIQIGSVKLKNRIVQAPMVTRLGETDGFMTKKEKRFYIERARGGIALATVGNCTIMPNVQPEGRYDGIWDNKFIPTWKDFVDAMHVYDAKVSLQLCHAGSQSHFKVTNTEAVAPSEMISPVTGEKCRELTKDEIAEIVEKFADAAVRAKAAGADMVEIQGVQGFLVQNFMTPLFNKRNDEYGGDLKGRMRFPLQVVKRIKEKAGNDYPVVFRMVVSDLVDGGITVDDTKQMAPMLVEAGADAIHFTAGAGHHVRHLGMPPVDAGRNCIVDLVAQVKPYIDVPVMVVQRIVDPLQAEEILADGKADIISMGRSLICDPDWADKTENDALEDIRICIGCCQGCYDEIRAGRSWTCIYNPEVGKEDEYKITAAPAFKKVMVVGGGPGGLEAARVAALRGHDVTLYEKDGRLGGQWICACAAPSKNECLELLRWYKYQIEKLNIKTVLNCLVTPDIVKDANPEVVIVATGANPIIPNIAGIDRDNVVTSHDVLAGRVNVSGEKMAIIGGGMVGAETAEFLAHQGKQVTLIEMLDEIAADIGIVRKPYMKKCLADLGIEMLTSTVVEEISDAGLVVSRKDGTKQNLGVYNNIILSVGAKPLNQLARAIDGQGLDVITIGDANIPRNALVAIADAARVGREI